MPVLGDQPGEIVPRDHFDQWFSFVYKITCTAQFVPAAVSGIALSGFKADFLSFGSFLAIILTAWWGKTREKRKDHFTAE